jgi:hypothetical protein
MSEQPLSLLSVVGFSGSEDTLRLHPGGKTLIYPLGSTVVLRDKDDPRAQVRARRRSGLPLCPGPARASVGRRQRTRAGAWAQLRHMQRARKTTTRSHALAAHTTCRPCAPSHTHTRARAHATRTHAQEFLQGHTDRVSALALSRSGRYLASGQVTHLGFAADIIVWDLEARSLLHRMQLQKARVRF